jgi:hypothetical protein
VPVPAPEIDSPFAEMTLIEGTLPGLLSLLLEMFDGRYRRK